MIRACLTGFDALMSICATIVSPVEKSLQGLPSPSVSVTDSIDTSASAA